MPNTEYDDERDDYGDIARDYDGSELIFMDPGGNSALRAASARNPRNLPCPTCERPNQLTYKDQALGYQCDSCADADENGWDY